MSQADLQKMSILAAALPIGMAAAIICESRLLQSR